MELYKKKAGKSVLGVCVEVCVWKREKADHSLPLVGVRDDASASDFCRGEGGGMRLPCCRWMVVGGVFFVCLPLPTLGHTTHLGLLSVYYVSTM